MIQKMAFWRKNSKTEIEEVKDTAKEVCTTVAGNLPANIHENRKRLFEEIAQYNRGQISKEAIQGTLRAGFILLNCVTKDEQDEIMKCLLDVELEIKKNDEFTADQYDIYSEIISCLHSNRQEKIKALLKKVAQKINDQNLQISKGTIDFIISLTDSELEIIKELFRYTVGYGILNYENIANDFRTKKFTQPGSDNIKFLGRVFYNQDAIGGKAYTHELEAVTINDFTLWKIVIPSLKLNTDPATEVTLSEYLSNEQNKKEFAEFLEKNPQRIQILGNERIKLYVTKQPTSQGKHIVSLKCFAILTDLGVELRTLLENEIGKYPEDYLRSVTNEEAYKNFGLTYENPLLIPTPPKPDAAQSA